MAGNVGADAIGIGIMVLAALVVPGALIAWLMMRGGEKQFAARASAETGVTLSRSMAVALLRRTGQTVTEQRLDAKRVIRYDRQYDAISVANEPLPQAASENVFNEIAPGAATGIRVKRQEPPVDDYVI